MSWARFHSENGVQQYKLSAFRGYLDLDATAQPAPRRAPAQPGTYKTAFQMNDQQGNNTNENLHYNNLSYHGDIPFLQDPTTGIEPTIRTIEDNGTSLYFDLQGRQLYGRPDKGVYIKDGKKFVIY